MEHEYIELSDNDREECEYIEEIFKDIFIDECIYESIDFIINFKECIPYFTRCSTRNITSNLQDYLRTKKIHKNIKTFKIIDEEILLFFMDYINNIIRNNKKLYKINENYELTLNEFIYLIN